MLFARWNTRAGAKTLASATCAVCLIVLGHGLVDSFLSFTTTYVLFALAAGLACSPALDEHTAGHANRV
jgi:hypothetical protein